MRIIGQLYSESSSLCVVILHCSAVVAQCAVNKNCSPSDSLVPAPRLTIIIKLETFKCLSIERTQPAAAWNTMIVISPLLIIQLHLSRERVVLASAPLPAQNWV